MRYGLPDIRKGNFIYEETNRKNNIIFKVFLAIPFLFELKTFTDWTFTYTALDLFQTLKFETLYAELFQNRCIMKTYEGKKLGDSIGPLFKIVFGLAGLMFILGLILAPLVIFSSLNPIADYNLVKGASF
jgi:hypothetical protein